jgi:hypothetical protein
MPHTINTPKPYTPCYRFELARTCFDLRSSCFYAQVFNGLRGGHPHVESKCARELTYAEGRFGGLPRSFKTAAGAYPNAARSFEPPTAIQER